MEYERCRTALTKPSSQTSRGMIGRGSKRPLLPRGWVFGIHSSMSPVACVIWVRNRAFAASVPAGQECQLRTGTPLDVWVVEHPHHGTWEDRLWTFGEQEPSGDGELSVAREETASCEHSFRRRGSDRRLVCGHLRRIEIYQGSIDSSPVKRCAATVVLQFASLRIAEFA